MSSLAASQLTLQSLPYDIRITILSTLSSFRDLRALQQTCKAFHQPLEAHSITIISAIAKRYFGQNYFPLLRLFRTKTAFDSAQQAQAHPSTSSAPQSPNPQSPNPQSPNLRSPNTHSPNLHSPNRRPPPSPTPPSKQQEIIIDPEIYLHPSPNLSKSDLPPLFALGRCAKDLTKVLWLAEGTTAKRKMFTAVCNWALIDILAPGHKRLLRFATAPEKWSMAVPRDLVLERVGVLMGALKVDAVSRLELVKEGEEEGERGGVGRYEVWVKKRDAAIARERRKGGGGGAGMCGVLEDGRLEWLVRLELTKEELAEMEYFVGKWRQFCEE